MSLDAGRQQGPCPGGWFPQGLFRCSEGPIAAALSGGPEVGEGRGRARVIKEGPRWQVCFSVLGPVEYRAPTNKVLVVRLEEATGVIAGPFPDKSVLRLAPSLFPEKILLPMARGCVNKLGSENKPGTENKLGSENKA